MAISLLGPLLVDGQEALPHRDRVVLAALAVHPGEVVSPERLADALWGDSPPKSWPKVVQGCVMRLRRVLGNSAVATTTGGYRLTVDEGDIDAHRFERLIAKARSAAAAGEQPRAAALYRQALQLWRGPPLTDLEDWAAGRAESARLRELRDSAREALTEAEIRSGHDGVAMASALVADDPLRERRWWLLALALYRAGRQNDALSTIRRGVRALREELGLDPGPELAALEAAILRGDPELAAPTPPTPLARTCPYQGLLAYGSPEAEWFFGRQDEIGLCRRALRRSPLLLVTGPSGVGKSSLVRAGLVPALEEDGHAVAVLTPGADPPAALTAALSSPGRVSVVVVDQLEELLPGGRIARGGQDFLDRLAGLPETGVLVVATLRADQLGVVAEHSPAFARAVEQGLHLVPRMTSAELREVIERPAQLAGARLEPGLVELLLREVADEPGALPLLSHALAETWERREADVLTVEAYQATGGIQGAVRTSAEGLYESLDARQRAAMRGILLRLVTTSPQGEAVAARVPKDAVVLGVEHAHVVDLLARARLVTVDEGGVTIAHEALTRAWPRLRAWLDEDQRGQRILRHVSLAAADWQQRGRPESELYRGARLEEALGWRSSECPELTEVEGAFLDASAARAEDERAAAAQRVRQQIRQNRRLRFALAGVGCALVAALAAGGLAVQRSGEARAAARTAHVGELVADSIALRSTDRDLAALLAVEAHRLQPGPATRGALLGLFTDAPGFLGYRPTGPAPLTSARMSNDGRSLVGVGADGAIRLLDPEDGGVRRTLPVPELRSQSAAVALAADRESAAVVSWQGSDLRGGLAALNVVDLADGRPRMVEARLPLDPGSVAMSADGRYVAVAGGTEGRVLVVEPAVLEIPGRTAVAAEGDVPGARWVRPLSSATQTNDVRHTAAVAFDRRGRLLVGSPSGVVRLVDPATGAVVTTWTGAPPFTSDRALALSVDGKVVSSGAGGVVRWDPRTRKPHWTASLDRGRCQSVVIAEATSSVICGGESGEVEGSTSTPGSRQVSGSTCSGGPSGTSCSAGTGRPCSSSAGRSPCWRGGGSTAPARSPAGCR